MNPLVYTIRGESIGHLLVWGLVCAATLTGTLMITVGMFEELPGMFRDVWSRSFTRR
jgi:hypothetical protein